MSGSASKRKMLIIGATGNIGSLATPALLERGENIRCMVRSEEKAQPLRDLGAEVIIGDLNDKGSLGPAMDGVDTVFLVLSINPDMREQGFDAIDAAVAAGVERVVRYSAVKTSIDDQMPVARIQAEIDAKLEATGLRYSHVRPHNYMQGVLMMVSTIQSDSAFYMPVGEGRVATTDLRDISDAVVEVLTGDGHDGKSYSITGPEAITFHEVAAAISDAIGKKVTYVDIPQEAARESFWRWVSTRGRWINTWATTMRSGTTMRQSSTMTLRNWWDGHRGRSTILHGIMRACLSLNRRWRESSCPDTNCVSPAGLRTHRV